MKLKSIVANPALTQKQKEDIVNLLTQTGGGGAEASKAVKNLLQVMSENGRLGQLDGVVNAFEKIMRAHNGEVDVIVTSAQVACSGKYLMIALGYSFDESFRTIDFKVVIDF